MCQYLLDYGPFVNESYDLHFTSALGGLSLSCISENLVKILSPIIFLWTILDVIFSLQVFTEAYVMTKGGPLNSTMFFNLYLYFKAFDDYSMGYASALAWVLLLITLLITLIQFKLSKRWVHYEN